MKNIFFKGEKRRLLRLVSKTVINNQICVNDLMKIIELSGTLSNYGIKAESVLKGQLNQKKSFNKFTAAIKKATTSIAVANMKFHPNYIKHRENSYLISKWIYKLESLGLSHLTAFTTSEICKEISFTRPEDNMYTYEFIIEMFYHAASAGKKITCLSIFEKTYIKEDLK